MNTTSTKVILFAGLAFLGGMASHAVADEWDQKTERPVILSEGPVLTGSLTALLRAEDIPCHAGRGGELAHPADSAENGRGGRWAEWRRCSPGPAPDYVDFQDAAAAYQSRAKLSDADAGSGVASRPGRPTSSDPFAECNRSRACEFRKLQ